MILPEDHAQERLRAAERRGLKLAIFCRTFIIGIGAGWYIGIAQLYGTDANPWAVSALAIYFFSGLIYFFVIGTSWDLPALKYAVYAADVVGICVLFAILPLWSGDAVPQILVFRAYGIYYLFPILALSTLALSWRLVIWTGLAIVISWWGLFVSLIWPLTDTVSWGSLTPDADAAQYIAILLDPGFIGTGNRMEETALLLFAALILALTVYRARAVFFAQIKAEAERSFLTRTFGEYVPEYLSRQLLDDPSALAPHERYATVMSVDIAGFTTFAERSTPSQTIGMLNAFFTDAAALIGESEGLIVDFSGDGFLATYNAPLPVDGHEQKALKAAMALLDHVRDHRFDGQTITIRLGLATGEIAAGSVGGGGRRAYTVHGDTVNLAARLQDMAKTQGGPLLMDTNTAKNLEPALIKSLGETQIRGRQTVMEIFSLATPSPDDDTCA